MKDDIRKRMRDEKKRLGVSALSSLSKGAFVRVESNHVYADSSVVMLYYPLWDEVDLRPLYSRIFDSAKRLILPTVRGNDIVPVEVKPDTEWKLGDFGILEPVAERYLGQIDLIVVPGVAFDSSFNRLGRGKGFYDRFLADHLESYRLGICFCFQKVDFLPVESFDLPMNEVIFI